MSFVTVPSFPTMPDALLSACDQAAVLRNLCVNGPMTVPQGATVLKITRTRALHLQALWGISAELEELIRRCGIAPEPAGLLARIETLEPEAAQQLCRAYLQREVTTGGLREALNILAEREAHQGGGGR